MSCKCGRASASRVQLARLAEDMAGTALLVSPALASTSLGRMARLLRGECEWCVYPESPKPIEAEAA